MHICFQNDLGWSLTTPSLEGGLLCRMYIPSIFLSQLLRGLPRLPHSWMSSAFVDSHHIAVPISWCDHSRNSSPHPRY